MLTDHQIPTRKLVLRISLRLILILSVIGFATLFLGPLLKFFLPFLIAFFAATLLAPVVDKISNHGSKIWNFWSMIMVLLLIVVVCGIVGYLGYYLVHEVADLIESWDSITEYFYQAMTAIDRLFDGGIDFTPAQVESQLQELVQSGIDFVTEKISSWAPTVFSGVTNVASAIGSFVIAFLFFLVGVYFIIADYPAIRGQISKCIPEIIRPHVGHLKGAAGSAIFGYIKSQLILSGIVALIIFIVLAIYGQKYSLLIAIAAGLIDLIPFFGSGTVLVPWAIITLLFGDYVKALVLLGLSFVLFLFRKIAEPKVMGEQTELSPLTSLICIYIGMKLGGVLGMILVPVLCMVFLGLYRSGFFDPTITDVKMLFHRIIEIATIEKNKE